MQKIEYTHPLEGTHDVKAVVSFASRIVSNIAQHGFGDDLWEEEWWGLSVMLSWVRDQVVEIEDRVQAHLKKEENDFLNRAGLPQAAFADEKLKNAWASGFSHGVQHAAKEGTP